MFRSEKNLNGYGHTGPLDVPRPVPYTCYYFMIGGCKFTAEECKWAHYDTGSYMERPRDRKKPRPFRKPQTGKNCKCRRTSPTTIHAN
jgi:hypothetical protein